MATVKKAVIYARVSSREQAEEELPIASQVEACEQRAVELGADVVRVFKDEGISGRTSARPAFLEAIEYCAVLEIDYFILWDTKRFARNHIDAALFKRDLRRGGTEIVYVSQSFEGEDGWLLEGVFNLMDESQSRRVSRDTKRSMMKNARDGHFNGGRPPYGYIAVPDGKRRRLAMLETEATVVRQIFTDCLAGSGTKSIALALNIAGVLRRGHPWTKNTVNYVLSNWVYAGYITFNRMDHAAGVERPVEDWIRTRSHPAIVSEEELMKVQQLMRERAPLEGNSSTLSRHLFTGILKCGACGMGLQIETATGRSRKVYSYYNCAGALKGKGCGNRRIPAGQLDAWLLDFIMDRVLSRARLEEIAREVHELQGEWVKERAARREVLVAEIRDVEARRANLYDLLELHGRGAPNLGDLTVRLQGLNGRIRTLEASLTTLEAEPAPAAEVDPVELAKLSEVVREILTTAEPKKVREFLASFIERIVLKDAETEIHYHPTRLVNARPMDVVQSGRNWLPKPVTLRTAVIRAGLPERFRRAA